MRARCSRIGSWALTPPLSDDFNNESRERLRFQEKCEIFYNTRPSPKLWRVLEHHLPSRVEEWKGMAVLFVRTGFADHVDLFMEAQAKRARAQALGDEGNATAGFAEAVSAAAAAVGPQPLDREALQALFQPCPLDAPRVTVVARPGAAPCVSYHNTATSPHFLPDAHLAARCGGTPSPAFDDKPMPPLEAYARCAEAAARGVAALEGGGAEGWGVLVLSDSPAVKCAVAEMLGRERVLFVPAPTGHVQYSAAHGVAVRCFAVSIGSLADPPPVGHGCGLVPGGAGGCADPARAFMVLHDVSRPVRLCAPSCSLASHPPRSSFTPQRIPKEALLQYGFPQFFEAGNERELIMKGVVALNEEVMGVLAGTCPSEGQLHLEESTAW